MLADGAGAGRAEPASTGTSSPSPGSRTVFLFEGINDIKAHTGVTADDLITGYREMVDRAHAAGKCVVGATVMPFKGWSEYDAAGEAVRQGVNDWIRHSGEFDAVVDFDRITRSPYDPQRMLPSSTAGTTSTPTTRACRRWRTPSTWPRCAATGERSTGMTSPAWYR